MNNRPINNSKMLNIFTIDTEDWYHANYTDRLFKNDGSLQSRVERTTNSLLQYFRDSDVTATFFVLGYVAQEHPNLIRRISEEGHEIASHGYAHQLVYSQSPKEFRQDVVKSKRLLEDITGKKVLGYRAPSWSITEKSLWALEILEELGFQYSSSIFPFKNYLYGMDGASRFPCRARRYNKNAKNLLEIPPSTFKVLGMNIPFSGGFYFRAVPYFAIKGFTKELNKKGKPTLFYLHPREIDINQPKLDLNRRDSFIHYYGIRSCERKLQKTLKDFKCISIEKWLQILNHHAF